MKKAELRTDLRKAIYKLENAKSTTDLVDAECAIVAITSILAKRKDNECMECRLKIRKCICPKVDEFFKVKAKGVPRK